MTVLLLLVTLISPSIAQNNFYSPPCPSPPPSPQCACDVLNSFSTGYVIFAPNTSNQKTIDNECHTYFPFSNDPCTFMAYFATVYCDGSEKTQSFIVTCNSSVDAIFSSPSCNFVDTTVTNIDGTSINIRRVISGDCSDIIYPALGVSSCPNGGSSSDLAQISQALKCVDYGVTNLYLLPRRYPTQCVTSQSTENTGTNANCPSGPCYGSDYYDDYDYYPSPSYDYNPPRYSCSPPPGSCGCSN